MKKQFQKTFADEHSIQYWDSLYDQENFNGDCIRKRMDYSLSWFGSMGLPQNAKVLDVGCGAGRPACEAVRRGYTVYGMDFSFGMLQKANHVLNRGEQPTVQLCQGDVDWLPYQDGYFDAILCLGVLAYLPSEQNVLREFHRILKPDGLLAVSIINRARAARLLDVPMMVKNKLQQKKHSSSSAEKNGFIASGSRLTTYLIPDIKKSLVQAGFTVCGYGTVPLEQITFFNREVFPRAAALRAAGFFEQFTNLPVVESIGGMCVFKAIKGPR